MPECPVARSPIRPRHPVGVRDGWDVSLLRSRGGLRLADCSPLTKVHVRASVHGPFAARLAVPFGRAVHDVHGTLVIGSGVGEWLLLAGPRTAKVVTSRLDASGDWVSVVDVTHGRALMRLTGEGAWQTLAKLCGVDLADEVTTNGAAFRSTVAKVATDVVRDDGGGAGSPERSYLVQCERSSGQYLFDTILDAGREFAIEVDGFPGWPAADRA